MNSCLYIIKLITLRPTKQFSTWTWNIDFNFKLFNNSNCRLYYLKAAAKKNSHLQCIKPSAKEQHKTCNNITVILINSLIRPFSQQSITEMQDDLSCVCMNQERAMYDVVRCTKLAASLLIYSVVMDDGEY